jgi:hypothetical protein
MALYHMMTTQEPTVNAAAPADTAPPGSTDLRAQMRDPRYWREKDPAFVAKVTQGFQKMYGK